MKEFLAYANRRYRSGNPIMSDRKYDQMKDEWEKESGEKLVLLDEPNETPIFLKTPNGSLEKLTNMNELADWLEDGEYYVDGKFDGISVFLQDIQASTRGDDGLNGSDVSRHFALIENHHVISEANGGICYRGECLICWDAFETHFAPIGYLHPRNAVAGLFNPRTREVNSDLLKHVSFVQYGMYDDNIGTYKTTLSEHGAVLISSAITEQSLNDIFDRISKILPCDGLVITKVGANMMEYETGTYNPKCSRAYKPKSFEQTISTTIIDLTRQTSKHGILKPVIHINPIFLNGANVRKTYGDNEAFLKSFGVGIGSEVEMVRSGGIIPRIFSVNGILTPQTKDEKKRYVTSVKKASSDVDFEMIFHKMASEQGVVAKYNYRKPVGDFLFDGVELSTTEVNHDVIMARLLAFVETLGMKDFGFETMHDINSTLHVVTIEDFCVADLNALEHLSSGYGKKKIANLITSRKKALTQVKEEILMASTTYFKGMSVGRLKVFLSTGIDSDGFGEKIKASIIEGSPKWEKFKKWFLEQGYTIKESQTNFNVVYCHTMCRIPKNMIDTLETRGIAVVDSYSKKVTHLVVPSLDVSSEKIKKGKKDGKEILLLSDVMSQNQIVKKQNIEDVGLF